MYKHNPIPNPNPNTQQKQKSFGELILRESHLLCLQKTNPMTKIMMRTAGTGTKMATYIDGVVESVTVKKSKIAVNSNLSKKGNCISDF